MSTLPQNHWRHMLMLLFKKLRLDQCFITVEIYVVYHFLSEFTHYIATNHYWVWWLFKLYIGSPTLSYFIKTFLHIRRPVPSTDQALPSCFYFRISWILMEQLCFYFFCPLGFLQGLRSLKHWLLQKLSMKNLDQKFKFLIKK